MKEKRNYKRFELIPFLAILGCAGMLLFECIFIFELYDRAPARVVNLISVQAPPTLDQPEVNLPAVSQSNRLNGTNSPAVEHSAPAETHRAPVSAEPPVEIEKDPVTVPVG